MTKVSGIKGFKPAPHKWPHSIAVTGAGYNGLKTAVEDIKNGQENITVFDRHSRFGGYCWISSDKPALWKMPADVTTREEFELKYGDVEEMDSADFDFDSKVEPFQRALTECSKDILITGRRMDQAAQRISLDIWEDGKRTLNPMAEFSWSDITAYVDQYGVPVNEGHSFAYRAKEPIEATRRHLPDLPWEKVPLGKPFWRCTDAEIKGTPPAAITYVFKSFGAKFLVAAATKTIELNERQACDVFCLLNGAFSPLQGFMDDAQSKLQTEFAPF